MKATEWVLLVFTEESLSMKNPLESIKEFIDKNYGGYASVYPRDTFIWFEGTPTRGHWRARFRSRKRGK